MGDPKVADKGLGPEPRKEDGCLEGKQAQGVRTCVEWEFPCR